MEKKHVPLGKELDWDIMVRQDPAVRYGDMEFGSLHEFTEWHRNEMKKLYGDDYFEKEAARRKRNDKIDKVFRIIMYCILGVFMLFMIAGLIKVLIYGHG